MFRSVLNSKIGELLNYLAAEVPYLSLTKALKLLYLIDEHAVRETGVPITWFDYKVWEKGPVAPEFYNEIKFNQRLTTANGHPLSFEGYINIVRNYNENRQQEEIFIKPGKEVDLSEFSEIELEVVNSVITKNRNKNAIELINQLHEEGTLWYKYRNEHQLDKIFATFKSTSNISIDFSELINEDPFRQMAAQAAYEALLFDEMLETE